MTLAQMLADLPAPVTWAPSGRAVLEMAIAIRESHRQGHAPVRLPLADRNLRLIPKRRRLQDNSVLLRVRGHSKVLCHLMSRSLAGSGTYASCASGSARRMPDYGLE